VIGWFLNEFTTARRRRDAEHAAIGRALSALMSFHRRMMALQSVARSLARMGAPHAMIPKLMSDVAGLIPKSEEAGTSLYDALDRLAETDPVLASRLRSHSALEKHVESLRVIGQTTPAPQVMSVLEQFIAPHADTALSEAIDELAARHGRRTLRAIRANRRMQEEMDESAYDMGKELVERVAAVDPSVKTDATRRDT
jgi:hypothetical protein